MNRLNSSECFDIISYLHDVQKVPNDPRLENIDGIQKVVDSQFDSLNSIQGVKEPLEQTIPFVSAMLNNGSLTGVALGAMSAMSVPTIYAIMARYDVKKGIKEVNEIANDIAQNMYYHYARKCSNKNELALTFDQVRDEAYAYEQIKQKESEELTK